MAREKSWVLSVLGMGSNSASRKRLLVVNEPSAMNNTGVDHDEARHDQKDIAQCSNEQLLFLHVFV